VFILPEFSKAAAISSSPQTATASDASLGPILRFREMTSSMIPKRKDQTAVISCAAAGYQPFRVGRLYCRTWDLWGSHPKTRVGEHVTGLPRPQGRATPMLISPKTTEITGTRYTENGSNRCSDIPRRTRSFRCDSVGSDTRLF
jgi:hypothetical protein